MEYRYSQQNSPNNEHSLNQGLQGQELLNDIYLDLFLKHVHAEQQIVLLLKAIDETLDANDYEKFMEYTDELLKLQSSLLQPE